MNSAIDDEALSATVRCPCGEKTFELLYPGQTHEYEGEQVPCTAEIDGSFFFILKGRCTACGREHVLLDQDFHGWNGLVCHDPAQAALARPELTAWHCPACNEVGHTGVVHIENEGKEDFLSEVGDEFDSDHWPDAFCWFTLDLTCSKCGKESPGFI